MVFSVVGTPADQEVLSEWVVEVDTGEVVASVIFRGGGAAVVVVAAGISDTVDSSVVTFFVVVPQSVVADVRADGSVVVSATWIGIVVDNSGALVVEVVSSVTVVCRTFSGVTGVDVVSGRTYGVVLLVAKGATGVIDSVVLAEVIVGKDKVPVATGGEVGRGEEVVEAVVGKPGGIGVVVVGGSRSTVTSFVLVSVCAVEAVLGAVVLSVTIDVSETGAGTGLEAVTIGVTTSECVVALVVVAVGCTTAGGGVGPSTELVVGAAVVDGCWIAAVVVKSGCRKSVGLVEEVSQNRAVIA